MKPGTPRWWRCALLVLLLILLLPIQPDALPAQSAPDSEEAAPPGRLVGAELTARVVEGGTARVEVTMELEGLSGRRALPLEALAFGGVPRDLAVGVDDGPLVPMELVESRPAFWEGRLPLDAGQPDRLRLRLTYRVDGALRAVPDSRGAGAELALPWIVVPWAPEDGAPDRVLLRVGFPSPVVLAGAFPAGLRPSPGGGPDGAAEWVAGLPVLPALVRAHVEGAPARLVHTGGRGGSDGDPPPMPPPGFVFTGLFVAFVAVTLTYLGWMVRTEGRA